MYNDSFSGRIQPVILQHLLHDREYTEQALPHLRSSFFEEKGLLQGGERGVFEQIKRHFEKYGQCPTKEQVLIGFEEKGTLHSQEEWENAVKVLEGLEAPNTPVDHRWLLDQTEEFIRNRRQHDFVMDYIDRIGKNKGVPSEQEYSEAISFAFDRTVGYDPFAEPEALYNSLTDRGERFPFDVDSLNALMNGGVSRKTLNVAMAATNVGKSLFLCHQAASYIRQHRAVLYITLEMSDKMTASRIMANLLDTEISQLRKYSSDQFDKAVRGLRSQYKGKLVIHEYPASSASVRNFRSLLVELKRKQRFIPDVIVVDYLNLCNPMANRKNAGGSYDIVGAVAKELRGLASENNVVLWTATQTNRSGYKNADLELGQVSEGYSVNSTADVILGLSRDENMPSTLNVKLLKHRNKVSIISA